MAQSMSGHIVLVGLGRLGYRTFLLLRRLGEQVVVIERDAGGEFLEEVRREGVPLLIGDARRETFLEEANIQRAKSIIAATNDDLANLEIALDARRLQPGIRVVLRMFDQNLADKIRAGFDIHIAISQSALSAPAFATAALDRTMVNSYVVGDQLVVMKRWELNDQAPLCGQTVAGVMARHQLCVIERRTAGGNEIFPGPDTRLQAGDIVLVQGTFDKVSALT
jgi:Trk K+ transport system NAD-binding subunit